MTKNILLFYGDEDYLIDEEIKKLTGAGSLNVETIDGAKAPVEEAVNAISAVTLLLGERIVIIKDPWFLKTQRAKKGKDGVEGSGEEEGGEGREGEKGGEVEQLIPVLESLSGGVKVIFVVYGNVDRRKKLYKDIEKLGEVREFKPYAEWEQEKLVSWIMRQVNKSGKKIGSRAAELLMEISGRGLRSLHSEIEKLVTYIGDMDSIDEKDVSTLASSGEISAFALTEAMRNRDLHASIEALTRLARNGAEPPSLIGLLASQFRMLLQVKSLKEQGHSDPAIASRLGANIYFVKKSSEKTHNYTLPELVRNLKLLHAADIRIKTGYGAPFPVLEMTLIDMTAKEGNDALQHAGRKIIR